jgi:hypothetical protein
MYVSQAFALAGSGDAGAARALMVQAADPAGRIALERSLIRLAWSKRRYGAAARAVIGLMRTEPKTALALPAILVRETWRAMARRWSTAL